MLHFQEYGVPQLICIKFVLGNRTEQLGCKTKLTGLFLIGILCPSNVLTLQLNVIRGVFLWLGGQKSMIMQVIAHQADKIAHLL